MNDLSFQNVFSIFLLRREDSKTEDYSTNFRPKNRGPCLENGGLPSLILSSKNRRQKSIFLINSYDDAKSQENRRIFF